MKKFLVYSATFGLLLMGCQRDQEQPVANQSVESQEPDQAQGVQREVTLEAGQLRAEVGAQAPLPKVVAMPIPEYPPEASKNGVSGRVTVRALIEKDGSISTPGTKKNLFSFVCTPIYCAKDYP